MKTSKNRLSEKGRWRCQKGLHHNKDCTHIVKTSEDNGQACSLQIPQGVGVENGFGERNDKMRGLVKLGAVWA